MRLSTLLSFLGFLLTVAFVSGTDVHFEDIDTILQSPVENDLNWFQRDLKPRTNSVPGSSSTSAASPSSTGSIGNQHKCHSNYQCQSGNCYHGLCQSPKPIGSGGCYSNAGCISGSCVNTKCVPKKGTGKQGQFCNLSLQCAFGTFCSHSKCKPRTATGGLCYKGTECHSGICVGLVCIEFGSVSLGNRCKKSTHCKGDHVACIKGFCKPQLKLGGTCYKNSCCRSNKCVHRKCA